MAVSNLTSAFGGETLTVSEMVKDPTYIPERVLENLDGAFLEESLFRNGGSNDGVVAYREAAAPYLNDNSEEVAEFAEIPVSDLNLGKLKSIIGVKTALGIRVSWEMQRFNKIDLVTQQTTALQNTMVENGVKSALAAFDAANVPTLGVGADWEDNAAFPIRDIRQAKRRISLAKAEKPANEPDAPERLMGYKPDIIVLNEATLDLALFHESTQKFYNGNAALENPVYLGVQPATLAGLRVVTSAFIPEGEAYIMQSGTAGFVSEAEPLTLTPLYSESGDNGFGGYRMSYRSDAFRHRVVAIDNPKSVVKLTGIEA